MISVRVQVSNNKFGAIASSLGNGISSCVDKAVADCTGFAKSFAPVDTGALRASIHGQKTGKYAGKVEDGVHYGIYQEFGTYKMAAQPFMRPAAAATIGPFASCIASVFK